MKWLKRIALALVVIVVVAYGAIYGLSSRILNRVYNIPLGTVTLPTDSASLANGERMARIVGCHGCHLQALNGEIFYDEPRIARLVTVNVPAKLTAYSDPEFERLLRRGVRQDGTSPVVMPPPGFYHLSDADVFGIMAWIRSRPRVDSGPPLPPEEYRILGRLGLATGQFKTTAQSIDTTVPRIGNDPLYLTSRRGEYLARIVCTECHGLALEGDPMGPSPALSQAVGYSLEEFTRLLRTGEPRGATKLTLMAQTATSRLHLLTDDEIAAVYAYITALPATGIPAGR